MSSPRVLGLALGVLLVACSGPAGQVSRDTSGGEPSGPPKRLTAAIQGELRSFYPGVVPSGLAVYTQGVHPLMGAGLTAKDDQGVMQPQLAESAPTVDNGLWKVFPDGRMEMTWRIKEGARWVDGTPVTTDDLLFTAAVMRDPQLPFSGSLAWKAFESVQAVDPGTITAFRKAPFISADTLFTYSLASPLPKHIVEPLYKERKDEFLDLPYWTAEYVGAGPFQMSNWVPGSEATLKANDHYALGRPKIDEIVIKMIPDGNTLASNILAGGRGGDARADPLAGAGHPRAG